MPLALGLSHHAAAAAPNCEIISDTDCLSRESADGFRSFCNESSIPVSQQESGGLIVVAGLRGIARERVCELRSRASYGAWILWESPAYYSRPADALRQNDLLHEIFGVRLGLPQPEESNRQQAGLYVRYHWPAPHLIRKFGSVAQFTGEPGEVIGTYEGEPVAVKKRLGSGGIIFLGNMLGPQLKAEDREARKFAAVLVRSLT